MGGSVRTGKGATKIERDGGRGRKEEGEGATCE